MVIKICNITELTEYEKRRFNNEKTCSNCGNLIIDNEEVVIAKIRCGKSVKYEFYHKNCVTNL